MVVIKMEGYIMKISNLILGLLLGLVAWDVCAMQQKSNSDKTKTPIVSWMVDPEEMEKQAEKARAEQASEEQPPKKRHESEKLEQESKKRIREEETSGEAPASKAQKIAREWEKFDLYQFAENCFKTFKEYSCKKERGETQIKSIITSDQFLEVLNDFIQLHESSNFMSPDKWMDECFPRPGLFNQETVSNYRHPYAQKLDLKKREKVFFKGDIHGSVHSLIRDLMRCSFLDRNLKIKDENQKMVFLGDYTAVSYTHLTLPTNREV